ncbi:IS5/IS1182 family transposase, partial [Halovibrio salipaludis]
MGTTFRPYSPDQDLLLPPSLKEWLPEGHLAYFISDVVEELHLSDFYARYEGDGRRKSPF